MNYIKCEWIKPFYFKLKTAKLDKQVTFKNIVLTK